MQKSFVLCRLFKKPIMGSKAGPAKSRPASGDQEEEGDNHVTINQVAAEPNHISEVYSKGS